MVAVEFARRLRVWLDHQGVTRAELAARLGVTKPAVTFWARGDRDPSHANLMRIPRALGLTVAKFFGPLPR